MLTEINRRKPMAEAKKLIAGASYDPAELKIIADAFEAAWQDIATEYASPLAIRAARLKLANVVLSLAATVSVTEKNCVLKVCA
jgi:hypothetical protein